MTTSKRRLDQQISEVEELISEFERENPGVVEAMETIGLTTDEYERMVSGMTDSEIQTSSTTG